MRTKKLPIAIMALLTGALVVPAKADGARFTDPNDTRGKLDVKAAGHGHDGARLGHSVHTYRRWRSRALSGAETYIGFYLDAGTKGTRADRFVWVRYEDGRGLYAEVFRPGAHANGKRLGRVRVTRPNRRSAKISLRPRDISAGIANGYSWRITTSYEKTTAGGPCGADEEVSSFPTGKCIDHVPRLRRPAFRHGL